MKYSPGLRPRKVRVPLLPVAWFVLKFCSPPTVIVKE